jgi:hypothetical protein
MISSGSTSTSLQCIPHQMARSVICTGYLQTHSLFRCVIWLISFTFSRQKTRHWIKRLLARYGIKQRSQVTDLWSVNSASTSWRILHSEDSHMKTTHYKSPWKWTFIRVSFELVNKCILKQSHIFWMLSVMRALLIHLQPYHGNSVVGDLFSCSLFLFSQLSLPRYCSMIIYYPSFCQVDQPPVLLHVMPLDCLLATILSALSFLSTHKFLGRVAGACRWPPIYI